MTTAPGGNCERSGLTAAAASIGSLTTRKAEAAAAATVHCKNVLRESLRRAGFSLMRTPFERGKMRRTRTTIAPNQAKRRGLLQTFSAEESMLSVMIWWRVADRLAECVCSRLWSLWLNQFEKQHSHNRYQSESTRWIGRAHKTRFH